ncbi:tRNA lysidine(34) synthetase TilS [Bartonella rattimassiliensis]|uniref:tRNA(Ile)-lysidine synthase n=1 Tax=Bartonella rattimassiliensis 15908 TaxID=1094556 RepID=J0QPW6_9HYPH|nr:tRNA lysidine(34) synthetase TilS [Bartonella rattimassiliensis]EJF87796.1 tRNA(Ile)-lysidine synthase [Bartonella rattimassiliensis 15908]
MCVGLARNLFKTSDFIQCQKVILAVSGGSDSLALMFLVKEYLENLLAPPEMIAVTVDHQLRRESACEAETVAEICRTHQIKHITVRWEGEKPKTHIASSARVARYDLLVKEAQKQGTSLIMTGHTLNDQVETYQMRYQRCQKNRGALHCAADGMRNKDLVGSFVGVLHREIEGTRDKGLVEGTKKNIDEKSYGAFYERGLSCIPREAVLHGKVRLIRPLLGVKRQTLRTYLRLKGKTWIEDPTNENYNFERVRVRHSLHPEKLADIAKKINEAALQRRQQAQNSANLILALNITVQHGHCFIVKPAPFLQKHANFPFVVGLFAVLMGGGLYLLPNQKLSMLVQKLCLHSPEKRRFTYAGSVIEYNKGGIALWREGRNMREAIVEPEKTFIWDGRYQITNHGSEAIKVGAANLKQLKSLLKNNHFDLKKLHFPSLQSLLMISNNKGCDIPELISQAVVHKNITIKRIMAPFNWMFSQEDAALVNVVEPFFNIEVKI